MGSGPEGADREQDCDGLDDVERYACMLRNVGLRATSPRIRILRFLEENGDHPDAESIHSALRETEPSLSMTTVYTNLETLRSKGLVSVLTISQKERRYEFGQEVHHHLLCDSCGRIYDIDVPCPYLGKLLHGEHKVKEVHGYFRGTCKHCLEAAATDENEEER